MGLVFIMLGLGNKYALKLTLFPGDVNHTKVDK
jgi:hypothetical protein